MLSKQQDVRLMVMDMMMMMAKMKMIKNIIMLEKRSTMMTFTLLSRSLIMVG